VERSFPYFGTPRNQYRGTIRKTSLRAECFLSLAREVWLSHEEARAGGRLEERSWCLASTYRAPHSGWAALCVESLPECGSLVLAFLDAERLFVRIGKLEVVTWSAGHHVNVKMEEGLIGGIVVLQEGDACTLKCLPCCRRDTDGRGVEISNQPWVGIEHARDVLSRKDEDVAATESTLDWCRKRKYRRSTKHEKLALGIVSQKRAEGACVHGHRLP
jgi:hypothetical protein